MEWPWGAACRMFGFQSDGLPHVWEMQGQKIHDKVLHVGAVHVCSFACIQGTDASTGGLCEEGCVCLLKLQWMLYMEN